MAKRVPDMYEHRKREKYGVEGNVLKNPENITEKTDVKNVHGGHRQRLRQRFLNEGLDNFQDHNALELLLFYSIPQKDTNNEAHALMNKFGSLSSVFDADFKDLCKVKGIGENTATLIKLMPELFRKYEKDKLNDGDVILNSAELVAKYTSKFFKGLTKECLYVLCLSTNCKVLSFEQVSNGDVKSTPLNNRAIIEAAINSNASTIILVHNHPSGITAPSTNDINATTKIADAMDLMGIKLSDHIIIGHGDDYFSFKKSEKWKHIFR